MKISLYFVLVFMPAVMSGYSQKQVQWDSASRVLSHDTTMLKPVVAEENKDFTRNPAIKNNTVSASPNPANTDLAFTFNIFPGSAGRIIILQATGAISSEVPVQGTHGSVEVDAQKMKEGLYFYYLLVEGKVYSAKKFVIRH